MPAAECDRLLRDRLAPLAITRPKDEAAIRELIDDPRVVRLVESGGQGDPRLLAALRLNAMLVCGPWRMRWADSESGLDAKAILAACLFVPRRKVGRSNRDDALRAILERLLYVHRLDRAKAISAVVERGRQRGWWKSRDLDYIEEVFGPLIDDVRRLYRRLDYAAQRGTSVPPLGWRWLAHAGDDAVAGVLAARKQLDRDPRAE